MKILNIDRHHFYGITSLVFQMLNIEPIAMELGVYNGKNARLIYDKLSPNFMYLIDGWSASLLRKSYYPFEPVPKWVDMLQADLYKRYYGGDPESQQTFDSLYQQTLANFEGLNNVKVIRADSLAAHEELKGHLGAKCIDYMYIDGNHQYEYVFNDLMIYSDFCSENAIIQMNDCCFSDAGHRQNLGVLEACAKFTKATKWRPLAINQRNWSDLLMAKVDSPIYKAMDLFLAEIDAPFIEVPDCMLGASRILNNKNGVVSMSFI
ncbi:class I SAM-dependent methyltransferase [Polynucleobacter sp. AP-Ainpum-60-G11]|uniref:class I SAM-dependent methyltransferase n=1 Tax=Polynucleobacter sp. AP-Ainpum-60-G11 TaxID=2576926 RepID=UPI001BFE1F66|nr:class I SAM-dependent methyltransferase [Polynucleobacter sp. AP-Ainpum-60-G11]QWE27142.1 class I SAM-dependent methyltransferase [Polynucleobacter sp. AP-Ainpum-60-G11]